jgi:hypothetical protein
MKKKTFELKKEQKEKQNFKVTLNLRTLEKMKGQDVERLIMNLLKESFEKGRVRAE